MFLVEGERGVSDALDAGVQPHVVVIRDGYEPGSPTVYIALETAGDNLRVLDGPLFDGLTETVHPQGILAILPIPSIQSLSDDATLVVLLDGIRDPGNMGTLLRSAAAAGADAVLIGPASVDVYSPKVVRSAMGAHFRVPIMPLDTVDPGRLAAIPLRALAEANAVRDYDRVEWREPCLVIVGSEATGPGEVGRSLANLGVAIPMSGGIESLNAGAAGAVILFEIARQRRIGR